MVSSLDPISQRLLAAFPDRPEFVELRAMLRSGQCAIDGLAETGELSFVASHAEMELIFVHGHPAPELIRRAVARLDSVTIIGLPEAQRCIAEALPEWPAELATIHRLTNSERLAAIPTDAVRLLSAAEIEAMEHVPVSLKEELRAGVKGSPVAAVCVGQLPVSFCYAGAETETLWDISIDTLDGYRRRGYAASCVAFLFEHFRQRGKGPVWGAVESNVASMKLAARLGFTPVARLVVVESPDAATD